MHSGFRVEEATLIDWRNATGELLDNKNIKYTTRYVNDGGRGTQGRVNKGEKAKRLQLLRTGLSLKDKVEIKR